MATRVPYSIRGEWNDAAVLAAFERLIDALADPRPLLVEIGAQLEANVQLRFETDTDPTGAAWLPLASRTLAAKRKRGELLDILQATNAMRQSLAYNVTGAGAEAGLEVGFSRATPKNKKGTVWQIAMLTEFGTSRGMPRRGLLTADPKAGTLGAADQAQVLAIVNEHLASLF